MSFLFYLMKFHLSFNTWLKIQVLFEDLFPFIGVFTTEWESVLEQSPKEIYLVD